MIKFLKCFYRNDLTPEIPTVYKIPTSTTTVDGRKAPYLSVKPGDILELVSGTRVPLEIKNLKGTDSKPIIIRNEDSGIAETNTTDGWYAYWIRNCQYFRFTGSNNPNTKYGIKITRSQYNGVIFQNKTDNFEIDNIQINQVDAATLGKGIGLQGQTVTTTTADYDYNNDGVIDNLDLVTRSNYTQKNWHIHDLLVDGGNTNLVGIGIYVGNSNYLEELNPAVENCHIHDITIKNVQGKCLQVGSVINGFNVHDVEIRDSVTDLSLNEPIAVSINPGCNGDLYNVKVFDCNGRGISWLGTGGKIYNNLVVRTGRAATYFADGIYVAYKGGYSHTVDTHIFNNTIIDNAHYGVIVGQQLLGLSTIRNNIIVSADAQYYQTNQGTTVSNNITSTDKTSLYFGNWQFDDYSLTKNSPAIDAGFDVSVLGLTKDIIGNTRPLFGGYDIGAYESTIPYESPSQVEGTTAMWLQPETYYSQVEIDNIISYSVSHGITDLYASFEDWNTNPKTSLGYSTVGKVTQKRADGKYPFQYLLEQATGNNIRVHAWVVCHFFYHWGGSSAVLNTPLVDNSTNHNTTNGGSCLNFATLAARDAVTNYFADIAVQYPSIASINLDYIRTDGVVSGITTTDITNFVSELKGKVSVPISVCSLSNKYAVDTFKQDVIPWLENNYIDMVTTMAYEYAYGIKWEYISRYDWANNPTKTLIWGLGAMRNYENPSDLNFQFKNYIDKGYDHFAIFEWNNDLKNNTGYQDVLDKRRTKTNNPTMGEVTKVSVVPNIYFTTVIGGTERTTTFSSVSSYTTQGSLKKQIESIQGLQPFIYYMRKSPTSIQIMIGEFEP